MDIKKFFRPSLMKVGTWILFVALSNLLYTYVKTLHIIPCRLVKVADPHWAFCSVDPLIKGGTLYFGLGFLDALYLNFIWPVIIFIGVFILAIPYSASCAIVELYRYFMQ